MNKTIVSSVSIAMLLVAAGCSGSHEGGQDAAAQTESSPPHWGYDEDDGPSRWASLTDDWSICDTGRHQSPIDLTAVRSGDVPAATMEFAPADLHIVHQEHVLDALDNGHTIQINYDSGETLSIGDESFELLQYHFHSPSEHTVDGEHYPMEMHLVHQADSGALAVIGVFVEEGAHNAAFDAVWRHLPDEKGEQVRVEGVQVDVDDMLPADASSYRYTGSLTTPPCWEEVRWILMTEPIQLDAAQIDAYRRIFTGNNRPTQPLNDREVVTDRVHGS